MSKEIGFLGKEGLDINNIQIPNKFIKGVILDTSDLVSLIPRQNGNKGLFLTTNGNTSFWSSIPAEGLTFVSVDGITITGDGTPTNPLVAITGVVTNILVSYNATTTISKYQPVTSDGLVADSTNITTRNKLIGLSNTNTNSGFVGQATGFGEITDGSWSWTIGDKIFLNSTSLSTTAPSTGYVQRIGTAVSSTSINVNIQQSILL